MCNCDMLFQAEQLGEGMGTVVTLESMLYLHMLCHRLGRKVMTLSDVMNGKVPEDKINIIELKVGTISFKNGSSVYNKLATSVASKINTLEYILDVHINGDKFKEGSIEYFCIPNPLEPRGLVI